MRQAAVTPTGVQRSFEEDEIIVTKTDPRGIITYANDVFLRVSALTEEQAVGKPHNIIRHPDMPRCVFKLLWDTLGRREEIFAYVVNLARDGAHYWVLAHVTPSFDSAGRLVGYHSNRRVPLPSAVREISDLYGRLRAEERRYPNSSEGLEAGSRLLEREVSTRSHNYEEYVWSLTNAMSTA